jgi:hypothetical protein
MARRRNIRGEQDARQCLAAVRASGQSRGEWARQHGVDGRSLYAWAKKLAPEKASGREKRIGVVELIPDSRPAASRYVVQCGQFAIEVDEHFDEATFGRLLKVVVAC